MVNGSCALVGFSGACSHYLFLDADSGAVEQLDDLSDDMAVDQAIFRETASDDEGGVDPEARMIP